MSEITDTDNQEQKDNISSEEEFDTKVKENLSQLIKAIFNSVMIILRFQWTKWNKTPPQDLSLDELHLKKPSTNSKG